MSMCENCGMENALQSDVNCWHCKQPMANDSRSSACSLCEGIGELDGFGGGGRTDCHKCEGTGTANAKGDDPNIDRIKQWKACHLAEKWKNLA